VLLGEREQRSSAQIYHLRASIAGKLSKLLLIRMRRCLAGNSISNFNSVSTRVHWNEKINVCAAHE